MLEDVETFLLYSLVNTYTYRLINHLEDNVSNYDTINDTYHGGYYLNPKLVPITIKGTKSIKRIIILELLLYYCYHEEADYGRNDTDAECS